jgi:hypothetical protein
MPDEDRAAAVKLVWEIAQTEQAGGVSNARNQVATIRALATDHHGTFPAL